MGVTHGEYTITRSGDLVMLRTICGEYAPDGICGMVEQLAIYITSRSQRLGTPLRALVDLRSCVVMQPQLLVAAAQGIAGAARSIGGCLSCFAILLARGKAMPTLQCALRRVIGFRFGVFDEEESADAFLVASAGQSSERSGREP